MRQAAQDADSKRILGSYRQFQQLVGGYTDIGEFAYLKNRGTVTKG